MITTETIFIVKKTDQNHKVKDFFSFKHVTNLQMTSGMDSFLLIKVCGQLENSKVQLCSIKILFMCF